MDHIIEYVSLNADSGALNTHVNNWPNVLFTLQKLLASVASNAVHVQANMKVERSVAWNACVGKHDGSSSVAFNCM